MSAPFQDKLCSCGSGKAYRYCCLANLDGDVIQPAWKALNDTILKVLEESNTFLKEEYGEVGQAEAWQAFVQGRDHEKGDFSNILFTTIFMVWAVYDWRPDPQTTKIPKHIPRDLTPAQYYEIVHQAELNATDRAYLKEQEIKGFSFFRVSESKPGYWLKLTDLLTGEQHVTQPHVAGMLGNSLFKDIAIYHKGDLLYSKVVTVDHIAILDGLVPSTFDPRDPKKILKKHISALKAQHSDITTAWLKPNTEKTLSIFWNWYESYPKPPRQTMAFNHPDNPAKTTFFHPDGSNTTVTVSAVVVPRNHD